MSWQQVALRRVFRLVNGGTPTSEQINWDGDVPWATPVDIGNANGGYISATQRNLSGEGLRTGSRTVPAGSLVLSIRAPIGYVAQATGRLAFNQGCRGLVPLTEIDARYFRYQLIAQNEALCSRGAGSTFMELSSEALASLPVLWPSLNDQRRIADFLDIETGRIDDFGLTRDRQLAVAVERLRALASMRTGRFAVRSIREVPEGWSIQELRRSVRTIRTGATPPTYGVDRWVVKESPGALPWYGPSSFLDHPKLGHAVKCIDSQALTDGVVPFWPEGAVLIVGIGATAGKVAYLTHTASGNQQITAMIPDVGTRGRFLAWQLWAASAELRELAPYTTLPIINNDFLKSFRLAVPSLNAQSRIAEELNLAADGLHLLEVVAARAKAVAYERRQALITAAVTGQIDVVTARGVAV